MTPRTFWLSFTNPDKPKGSQFLGVSIIEVTEEMAEEAREEIKRGRPADPGAEWLIAAIAESWRMACNPGGEIGAIEITGMPEVEYPKNRLLSKPDIAALEAERE